MADTVTTTTAGRVHGTDIDGVVAFLGIPYGAAPVGALRFRPPQPPSSWDGVRDCRTFGPVCPQVASGGTGGVMQVLDCGEQMNEDCLRLNVWTPAADGARRPTMVWIHGGGFRSGGGSCPVYAGDAFARDGVVLVTLNYRLNAFGFLYLDELFAGAAGTGNLGILDQIAALDWVRDNIAAFGGDPDNVTVFGESAGAMAVGTLLGMGAAPGRFRRAIAQSGAAHHAISPAAAGRVTARVLETLEVRPGDWEALRAAPTAALVRAAQRVSRESADLLAGEFGAAMPFQPVVDGQVLRARPIASVRAGAAAGVDVIVGTCADELRVVAWAMPLEAQRHHLDPAVAEVLREAGHSVDAFAAAYGAAWPDANDLDRHLAMETDYRYAGPAAYLAEVQGGHARTWLYRFSWATPVEGGRLGACHAVDVPFVFGTHRGASLLVGDDAPDDLSVAMRGAWTAFARTGEPGAGWPAYDPTRRAVMDFGVTTRVLDDPERGRRELWRDLVTAWAGPAPG